MLWKFIKSVYELSLEYRMGMLFCRSPVQQAYWMMQQQDKQPSQVRQRLSHWAMRRAARTKRRERYAY